MENNIKDYLKKQVEISKELNELLVSINSIEDREIDRLYKENEELLSKLNDITQNNISEAEDRLYILRKRVEEQLSKEDTKNNPEFRKYLFGLKSEITQMSLRVYNMNEQFSKMSKKHDNYMQKLNTNISSNDEIVKDEMTANKDVLNKEIVEEKVISDKVLDKPNKYGDVKINNSNDGDKFEFKIGSNVLNILGVILILISFITFGNYVYTNYMTDMLKGIFLFGISSVILLLGEKFFTKKISKFAIGITALGVGSLYVSLIVNYLVLETINSIIAIILTLIITAISIHVSKKHNSNTIRIIGLLGGYGCLMPLNYLDVLQSYITVIMLLVINIANLYIPIKDDKFSIYSSIFNVIFGGILMVGDLLVDSAIITYFVFTIIFNNIMHIRQVSKAENLNIYRFIAFLTTFCMINQLSSNVTYNILGMGLLLIAISAISYFKSNEELKGIFYIHGLYLAVLLLIEYSYYIGNNIFSILFVGLAVLTMYVLSQLKDIYLKVVTIIMLALGMFNFIISDFIVIRVIYGLLFTISIWVLSGKNKDGISTLVLKHTFFGAISFIVLISDIYYSLSSAFVCSAILSIIYVLLLTNIERLRDRNYKSANKMILITSIVFLNLLGYARIYTTVLSLAISGIILVMLNTSKYVESEFMTKHNILVYSLYTTYTLFVLLNRAAIDYDITNLILSISLMIIAFANVWIGFKLDILEVRRYGLILSLLVCAKLIFVDFYYYSFIVKTGLFLITGIVALVISYIYSKLEQELKIKNNSQSKEQSSKLEEK